jgi:transposase
MKPDKWETYGKIRAMHTSGISDREIAKALGVGRRTVRKYRDGAVTPGDRAASPRKAPLKEAAEGEIRRMLLENTTLPRKQRLSA